MSEIQSKHGEPSWISHQGKDSAAARTFYEQVLGWQVADLPMQDGSAYPAIMVGDQAVGCFAPQPSEEGQWLIYVTVDDVDHRHQAALDSGAQSVSAPMSVPGVGRMATIRDPFGALLAFITYETKTEA